MSARGFAALVAAVSMLGIASCKSESPSSGSPYSGKRPASTAQLSVALPRNGETVKGPKVRVTLSLVGATVVPETTTVLEPDEGHLHVKLDDKLQSMTAGTTFELDGVGPGSHVLSVEFVASDHAPFDPRVVAAITFRVA